MRAHEGAAREFDGDLIHRLHDVGGRDDVALRADHDARADSRDVRETTSVGAHVTAPAADHDHARAHVIEDAAHVIRHGGRRQEADDGAHG